MDQQTRQELMDWLHDAVGGVVTTAQLRFLADASPLPAEAKRMIDDLPDREWTKDDLLGTLSREASTAPSGRR